MYGMTWIYSNAKIGVAEAASVCEFPSNSKMQSSFHSDEALEYDKLSHMQALRTNTSLSKGCM